MRPVGRREKLLRGVIPRLRLARLVFAMVALFALAGCGTSVRTSSEADEAVDFGKLRTYAWRDSSAAEQPPEVSALTLQALRGAIERELGLRGLQRGDPPDVLVSVRAGSRDRLRTTFWGRDPFFYGDRYGRYPPWPITDRRTVDTYQENLVAIDMFDAKTAKPVWSGIGATTAALSADDREAIDTVVTRILSDFPPGWSN